MDLGSKIKYYLVTKYKSIQKGADALKITRQQLYPYFNNDVEPGASFLKKLFKDGCDINWLLSDDVESEERLIIMEKKIEYGVELQQGEELKKSLKQIKSQVDSVLRSLENR